jgi:hypothetical protein
MIKKLHLPGANPTVVSYNASAVILYNATNSVFKNLVSTLKNTLAPYVHRYIGIYKWSNRRMIGSRFRVIGR